MKRINLALTDSHHNWLNRFSKNHETTMTDTIRRCLEAGMYILDNYYEDDMEIYFKDTHLGNGEEIRLLIL